MSYSAGDLDLTLQTISKGSIDSLNLVIEKLNSIKTLISTTGAKTLAGRISKGGNSSTYTVDKMGKSYLSASTNVKKLGDETKKVTRRFNEQGKEIKRVTQEIDKYNNKTTTIQSFLGKEKSNGLFSFQSIAKIGTFIRSMTRVARIGAQILQYGVDYTETLNLWQVAMGDNLALAEEFVNKMNKAYGISEKTLMNAQAIFKNMIGSLGQVSETTAYNLSEAITQMAIDYSSLYNVSIDAAVTKFQAALAGQVRPIRSVSGYDITENTLYQLYQSIGGNKTMRQLSRTEKQLLSIYAIFQQMGASGALGDMDKTINQVANQSRMMAENWEQVTTWAGVSLQYFLQSISAFKYINALLITTAEILKAVAYSLGYKTPDFANSWAGNVTETEDAVDSLQGKLLDFDKFRSLNGAEQNVLGIDTKLLEAISGYTNDIGNATSAARELATQWLNILGFVDKNGDGVLDITEKSQFWLDVLVAVGSMLAMFGGATIISGLLKLTKTVGGLTNSTKSLNLALAGGLIFSIYKAIKAFSEGDYKAGILSTTLGVGLYGTIMLLNRDALTKFIAKLDTVNWKMLLTKNGTISLTKEFALLSVGVIGAFLAFSAGIAILNVLPEKYRGVAGGVMVLVGAFVALAAAILATQQVLTFGAAGAIILPSIALAIAGLLGIFNKTENIKPLSLFAEGGLPDKGTMFVAGEAGAEMVYNMPSGQSGVANIEQIQQAMFGALMAYGRTQNNTDNRPIEISIDGEKVFQATRKNAQRHGLSFSKV